jgi:hypothetical protein
MTAPPVLVAMFVKAETQFLLSAVKVSIALLEKVLLIAPKVRTMPIWGKTA